MNQPKDLIGHISGGRVLDVATGSGGFVHFLVEGLQAYSEIIGIDANEHAAAPFTEAFKDTPHVVFEPMDARQMIFPEGSFDTVCIANSLHHFEHPEAVLSEMLRVLRAGGHFILAEMYCDGQTDTQMTHVLLHHWWAAVDQTKGIVHRDTHTRTQLAGMLEGVGLGSLAFHDLSDTEEDPKQPDTLAELDAVITRYIQRAEGYPDLQAQGETLRQRLHQVGFHGAASLFGIGIKA